MEIRAERVRVDGPHGPLLPPTSLHVGSGELVPVGSEPGLGLTTLALALGGRVRPSEGTVTLDGKADPAALRRRVAVVDAPGVSEPDDGLRLGDVIAEELALAGTPARSARQWLAEHDAAEFRRSRMDQLPAHVRTGLLLAAAAARPGVGALVLVAPDRHSSTLSSWWPSALSYARQGLAVVVLCAVPTAATLPVPVAQVGQLDQPAPLVVTPATATVPASGDFQ